MTSEVRIYIEGGGDGSQTKAQLRQGFSDFFSSLVATARSRRIKWSIVVSGSRTSCYEDFCNALVSHHDAFNVLLVDSEEPVTKTPRQHLLDRDRWQIAASDDHCHLMVQTMEAWLIADRGALIGYYGDRFLDSAIPGNLDVEAIDKATLEQVLNRATTNTQKGKYRKIAHGAALLSAVSPEIVRSKAMHCDRLFHTLEAAMLTG